MESVDTPKEIYKCVVSAPNKQDGVFIGLTDNYDHMKPFKSKIYKPQYIFVKLCVENKNYNHTKPEQDIQI